MWNRRTNTKKPVVRKQLDIKDHDSVFNELMQECKQGPLGARFSKRLRGGLEKMRPEERRALCRRTRDRCAPLFVACKRGNVEIVEYLIHVCAADLEQRGVYVVTEDHTVHSVTPLWCAAVAGRLPVLRVLADAGADLDACSDSGSTAVRSACFMSRVDVVEFLLERGADIHRPNHNGGTCLINSVQSLRLLKLLLQHGADVNACDMQRKTALHYAVQEQRVEATRLLLEHGANPCLPSHSGDDALRIACLKGAAQVVTVLSAERHFCPARVADAYELLGSTQLDELNDLSATLTSWRRATGAGGRRGRRAHAVAAGGGARAGPRAQGHHLQAHVPRRVVRGRVPLSALHRPVDVGAADPPREGLAAVQRRYHGHVPHGERADAAAAGRARQPAGARARAAAARGRGARVRAAGGAPAGVPARARRAARAQEAGGDLRPRAALRHAPAAPAGGCARAAARGGVRARAPPAGRRRAQRPHRRHAAAPRRLALERHPLHVLRGRGAGAAGVPVGGRGVAAAGVRRGPLPAQRGALHTAARRRHTVQLLHGAGGAAAGGRRAHRPAQQVRGLRGRADRAQPRHARLPAALHHAALPGRARRARLAPPRAARRPARDPAPLPAPAPPLGAPLPAAPPQP